MFKMYFEKWILLIIILKTDVTIACLTTETAFGWLGSSPVFQYTYRTEIYVQEPVSLLSPNNGTLFIVEYFRGRVIRSPVYTNCSLAPGGDIRAGFLNIQLNPLQTGQAGTYQYKLRTAVMKCITLHMYGVPTQPTIGSNVTVVYEGMSAVLTCSSASTTVPSGHNLKMTYEWRRDGVTVSTGGQFTLDPTTGRTLTISYINRNDQLNSFSCRATEQGANTSVLSSVYSLTVGYGPESARLSPSDASYTLNENQPLNDITCWAECYPACTYAWTKYGVGTVSSINGVLTLTTLHRSETGTYWCTATNAARSVNSSSVIINVNHGPDLVNVTPPSTSYTLNENQPLNDITCSASTCSPVQCTYQWIKSGVGAVSNTSVLSLGTLQRDEAGNYMCTASNPVSAVTASSQHIGVLVRYGPESARLSPSDASHTLNENQPLNDITCWAECYPACTYAWIKYGVGTVSSINGVLTLATLHRSETGTYWCTATNAARSVNSSCYHQCQSANKVPASDETESTSSARTAAIAGGIIGSFCGIIIIVLVVVAVMRYDIKCVRSQVLCDGHSEIRQIETTSPCEGNGPTNQAYETLDIDQGKAIYTSLSQQVERGESHVYLNTENNAEKAVYTNTSFETVK